MLNAINRDECLSHVGSFYRDSRAGEWPNRAVQRSLGRIDFPIRLAWTPTVALFGPSAAELFGPGEFLRDAPYRAVTIADFPCRDQNRLFKRDIAWIRRCQRTPDECPAPRCLHAIDVATVADAALALAR